MSTFDVKVVGIDAVENHPDADRLILVHIGGYRCIAGKNEDGSWPYAARDRVIYIPEAALIPDWLLRHLGFWKDDKGTLAGREGNRVKAIRLRGIVSQGILLPVESENMGIGISDKSTVMYRFHDGSSVPRYASDGEDVMEALGITKWEPPVPTYLAGEVCAVGGKMLKFDVESWQKFPNAISDGEEVVASEKLHGTFNAIAHYPGLNHPELFANGDVMTGSKGLSAQGLVFKNNEANINNLYCKNLRKLLDKGLVQALDCWRSTNREKLGIDFCTPIHILGEIFGKGIQDLAYAMKEPAFRVFDVWVGDVGTGRYLNDDELDEIVAYLGLERCPVVYRGPFSYDALVAFRDGKSMFDKNQIREGIVFKTVIEGRDMALGRKMLKLVSPDYLLRKGEVTEFN